MGIVTTPSNSVTGGSLIDRARSFGLHTGEVDGTNVELIWSTAREVIQRVRNGDGASYLHASCTHLEGHLLGDELLRVARHPLKGMLPRIAPILRSILKRKGAPLRDRVSSLKTMIALIGKSRMESASKRADPLEQSRTALSSDMERLQKLEGDVGQEILQVIELALE